MSKRRQKNSRFLKKYVKNGGQPCCGKAKVRWRNRVAEESDARLDGLTASSKFDHPAKKKVTGLAPRAARMAMWALQDQNTQ